MFFGKVLPIGKRKRTLFSSERCCNLILLVVLLISEILPYGRCSMSNKQGSPVHNVHQFFDKEQYEIKSCLSADLEQHEQASCRFFALMIDAGSTGTRLHAFEFSHDNRHPASPFKLETEVFQEVKPGLSSFAGSPREAAASVEKLLDKAKATVPRGLWPHTPLALKATAGLRLLPPKQSEDILDEIEVLFKNSPFLINDDSVTIMSGTDEGIFGWFTLNFLLDRIDSVLLKPQVLSEALRQNLTAAALDLGGGSTQVTFRPLEDDTVTSAPEDFIKDVHLFGETVPLLTHSYLNNGLVAARLGTMMGQTPAKAQEKSKLFNICLPPDYSLKWNYNGREFLVKGSRGYSFGKCQETVKNFVAMSAIYEPPELIDRDIYAFSYFYDRGLQAGLTVSENGGLVQISQFREAAEKACAQLKLGPEHWQPWQCLDLTYIYTLLTDGYGLPEEKQISLSKKIRGMETSWALGAAYHLLNTYHEEQLTARRGHSVISTANKVYYYVCSRMHHGLTTFMSFFQLLA